MHRSAYLIRGAVASAIMLIGAPACAHEGDTASVPITDFSAEEHKAATSTLRYTIVIHSGAGIPGSPGASDYYKKPKQVLQAIVDTCNLGKTLYQQATDGVSVLHILDADLAQSKVDCVKSAEEPGLRLSDRGATAFQQTDADKMAKSCGLPTTWARVLENGAVSLDPPQTTNLTPETLEAFGCFMELLRDAEVDIGFIGNDRFRDPKEN